MPQEDQAVPVIAAGWNPADAGLLLLSAGGEQTWQTVAEGTQTRSTMTTVTVMFLRAVPSASADCVAGTTRAATGATRTNSRAGLSMTDVADRLTMKVSRRATATTPVTADLARPTGMRGATRARPMRAVGAPVPTAGGGRKDISARTSVFGRTSVSVS